MIAFVENKPVDMNMLALLLEECRSANQWANFGPLYDRLSLEYAEHLQLAPDLALTPCANGGVALELLARAVAQELGKPRLRWVGSAFSFKNLGRGYFADMTVLDCDEAGMLDVGLLSAMATDAFDGVIVTNPLGMSRDFAPYMRFARATGKSLIIDNAAGLDPEIPDWPWQCFSLHHTKPYGMGEGGLVLTPRDVKPDLLRLINYDAPPADPRHWFTNGKISDLACAYHLMRLRSHASWAPHYVEQRLRITEIFRQHGIMPLMDPVIAPITTALPVLFPGRLEWARIGSPPLIPVTRQYTPVTSRPVADAIYDRILNFPVHPDMSQLSDAKIIAQIGYLLDCMVSCEQDRIAN